MSFGIAFSLYGHSTTVSIEVSKTFDLGSNPSARAKVAASGDFKLSTTMNKITTYFRESYKELMEKVTWPSWSQLQQSTVIVLVATLLITVLVWIMDLASSSILHFTYSLFSS